MLLWRKSVCADAMKGRRTGFFAVDDGLDARSVRAEDCLFCCLQVYSGLERDSISMACL